MLEIIIATLVLTAAGIAVIWALNVGIFAAAGVENVDLALNIAQERMENIRNAAFADITDSGPAAHSDFPDFNVEVDADTGSDPMPVEVIVSWDDKAGPVNVTLTTLVTSY